MKMIAEQIRHLMQDVRRFEYRVCMFPRKTTMCERVLEEEGVFDDISLTDFDLGFIPIDDNLISLEMSDAFRELKLHQDMTNLFDAAKAIMQLQVLCGIIPVIKGKGENAKVVADMLIKLREEVGREDEVVESELTIDELILVDRELDLVTPMLTPLSYEGLIDEIFGIQHGFAALPSELVPGAGNQWNQRDNEQARVKVSLSSQDELFVKLRDLHPSKTQKTITERDTLLKTQQLGAINMNQRYEPNEDEKRVMLHAAVSSYLNKLLQDSTFSRQLEIEHLLLSGNVSYDAVMDVIEEMMYKRQPFNKVMKMMCLVSTLCGGIKKHAHYKRELLQVYGYEYLFALNNLEKANLFTKAQSGTLSSVAANIVSTATKNINCARWESIRKKLDVVPDWEEGETGDEDDRNLAELYGGYIPVSLRLVQKSLSLSPTDSFTALEQFLSPLPGPFFHLNQLDAPENSTNRRHRVVLVMFIGGLTFAEVSGMRLLASNFNRKKGAGVKELRILTATTKVMNGETLLNSLGHVPANMLKTFTISK
uniref:Uncharacterized protein n=1 Tax=Guillardia theta TaxID=55529 RepID=A0A7S4HA49_GUITH